MKCVSRILQCNHRHFRLSQGKGLHLTVLKGEQGFIGGGEGGERRMEDEGLARGEAKGVRQLTQGRGGG